MRVSAVGCAVLCGVLSGCAHVPDVTVKYYLAQSKVSFRVIRTISCDANNQPVLVASATPMVAHAADRNQQQSVELSKLSGALSDSDIKFEFYEDGRLKSVNSASTGQGEAVFKTVLTVAAAVFGLDASYKAECDLIRKVGGGKPLTLTYEGAIGLELDSKTLQAIPPDAASAGYAESLRKAIGGVCAVVESTSAPHAPAPAAPVPADPDPAAPVAYKKVPGDVVLTARQPGVVQIKLTAGRGSGCQSDTIWQGQLPAAQVGTLYKLPLPPPATFGKLTLGASFAESGALTSLQYVNTSGSGQLMNVVGAAQSALKPETTAQKAADVKAEADLIAQQQRLVQCLADPTSCK